MHHADTMMILYQYHRYIHVAASSNSYPRCCYCIDNNFIFDVISLNTKSYTSVEHDYDSDSSTSLSLGIYENEYSQRVISRGINDESSRQFIGRRIFEQ